MDESVDVLTVGESMGAVRSDGLVRYGTTARLTIAGTEGNVAIGLTRLGHRARWVGVVGADQMGALILRTLRAEDVDTSFARVDQAAPTGIVVYEERMHGLLVADYHRRSSAATRLIPADLVDALLPTPRFLHVTGVTVALGEGPRSTITAGVRQARALGVRTCLDVNHRKRLWSDQTAQEALRALVDHVDLVVASSEELPLVADGNDDEERAHALFARGVDEVVVKLGAAGATSYSPDGIVHCPGRAVEVADSVGAGDGFVAGLLSGFLDGLQTGGRLERANSVGAFVVSTSGDWEGLPTRSELAMLDLAEGDVVR